MEGGLCKDWGFTTCGNCLLSFKGKLPTGGNDFIITGPCCFWESLFAYSYVLNLCTLEITLCPSAWTDMLCSLCVDLVHVSLPTSFPLKFEYGLRFIKWWMWNSTWIWAMILWDVILSWWWIILHLRQEERGRRKGRGRERRVKKGMWRKS